MVKFNSRSHQGFTIVELLIVIVIIAILTAVVIVAFASMKSKAIAASLQSDLDNSSKQLKMYNSLYGMYPKTLDAKNCPLTPNVDANYCLKASSNNTLAYCAIPPYNTYALKDINTSNLSYVATDDLLPTDSSSQSAIFNSGGSLSSSACFRVRTFSLACSTAFPCTVTAAASGKIVVVVSGGGGGAGGGGDIGGGGLSGGDGFTSTLTLSGTTYSGSGGRYGSGSGRDDGGTCYSPFNGTSGLNGTVVANGLAVGTGSSGGAGGGSAYGHCVGGNGGSGGQVSGVLSVSAGQTINIIVGSGGFGGAGDQSNDGGADGQAGTPGQVTISYF